MLIDWFTVIAQIANFLILVWLMKRYLYLPILSAIDAREARIAAELKDAAAKKAEATQESDDFRRKNEAFEQQRDALLNTARNDAKVARQKLLDEARKDADVLRAKLAAAVQGERELLGREVTLRVQNEVFAIARQTLADLATVSVEAQICNIFCYRLRALENTDALATALKTTSAPTLVRSAFALPAMQREDIHLALKEIFGAEIPLTFDTVPGMVCGIELSVNGQKVAWSIADYLTSLDSCVNAVLAPHVPLVNVDAKAAYTSEPWNGSMREPVIVPPSQSEPASPATANRHI